MELPKAFQNRIKGQFPKEADLFFEALEREQAHSIRQNASKPFFHPELTPVPWNTQGRFLSSRPVFALDPLWHAGAYYVQESSSMFLEYALKQLPLHKEGLKALDLCAAPGGKSTILLDYLDHQGVLVSNEVIRNRTQVLRENLVKWGHSNFIITNNDPQDFQKTPGLFDLILVDAPCSGEGLFRKDTQARKEWSEDHVVLCAARQNRILQDALPALKNGGYLIYSTCTYAPDENEEQIQALIRSGEYESVDLKAPESWQVQHPSGTGYAFYPHQQQGEGLYLCVLRKQGAGNEEQKKGAGNREHKQAKGNSGIQILKEKHLGEWATDKQHYQFGSQAYSITASALEMLQRLEGLLRIVQAGMTLAEIKGKLIKPHPELSFLNTKFLPQYELEILLALRFLKKDDIVLTNAPKGWLIMTFKGMAIGLAKNLGNRVNNYYPKYWRLQMPVPSEEPEIWHS